MHVRPAPLSLRLPPGRVAIATDGMATEHSASSFAGAAVLAVCPLPSAAHRQLDGAGGGGPHDRAGEAGENGRRVGTHPPFAPGD